MNTTAPFVKSELTGQVRTRPGVFHQCIDAHYFDWARSAELLILFRDKLMKNRPT